MAQRKDEYEDEEDQDNNSKFSIDKLTVFTLLALVIICELFFHFLSLRAGGMYGFKEMIFAVVTGIVMTLFLLWCRFIMASNRFLGGFISVAGIIAFVYALTRKYQGPYTITFMSIGICLALFYTIFYFVKFKK
jgi:hypothetical protein